jgi:hypothetical protein
MNRSLCLGYPEEWRKNEASQRLLLEVSMIILLATILAAVLVGAVYLRARASTRWRKLMNTYADRQIEQARRTSYESSRIDHVPMRLGKSRAAASQPILR